MSKRVIIPIKEDPEIIISNIRKIFGLEYDPYLSIDNDLLLIAFTPKCKTRQINSKYKTCNHQSLEFYGDKAFYSVVASLLYDIFGLNATPGFLTNLNSRLTKNMLFFDLMRDKNACILVRGKKYNVGIKSNGRFHNECADTFEAIIGVLFIHLNNLGLDFISYIKTWLFKNTGFAFALKTILDEMDIKDKLIYFINDRIKLKSHWISHYTKLINDLNEMKSSISPEIYLATLNNYNNALNISEDNFSNSAVIIERYTPIDDIFYFLNWNYNGPILENDTYVLTAGPNGITYLVSNGKTPQETIQEALNYLKSMGYIVYNRKILSSYSDYL